MPTEEMLDTDGRRARRQLNRSSVIDALYSLLDDGVSSPSVDAIAERAGVSVSSLYRYFESIDDLHEETIVRFRTRFATLIEIPSIGIGTLDERIVNFVNARIVLYRSIAPVARLARARALELQRFAEALAAIRGGYIVQIRTHFATDLGRRAQPDADHLVALIDTMTSFESWDLLGVNHALDDDAIRRTWTTGLTRLLLETT